MNVAMLTDGIEKRVDGDEFVWNVDGELGDLRCDSVSESRARRVQDGHHRVSLERTQTFTRAH